jgi:hypothetical protein|tara:strand:+ start:6403 stop:6567 length:165 start_codon:yes stop_codon:yes gene_type:complete
MEDNRPYPDVLICTLQERVRIAKEGLKAIAEESADISPAKKIAEKTLEEIDNCK